MYMACRHIKPNGLRCKSPALRGNSFCYFHARLHNMVNDRDAKFDITRLPVPEDPAAIQIALSQIFDGLLTGRIEGKLAGRLLYGLQIASQHAQHHYLEVGTDSVLSVTQTSEGEELAPELRICNANDDCSSCQYAKTCPNYDPDDEDDDED